MKRSACEKGLTTPHLSFLCLFRLVESAEERMETADAILQSLEEKTS